MHGRTDGDVAGDEARGGDPRRRAHEHRVVGLLPRPHRAPRQGRQRGRDVRLRPRPGVGGCGRRGPHDGRCRRSAARAADHDQGRDRDRGHPVDWRREGTCRPRPAARRAHGGASEGRGRDRLRQDELPYVVGRRRDAQRAVRHEQQSVGPRPDHGRIVGRRGGRSRGGVHQLRARHRHRRVGAHPVALLRRVRPEADVGCRLATRVPRPPCRRHDRRRHQRVRSDRALCRRPRPPALRARGAGARPRGRVAPRPAGRGGAFARGSQRRRVVRRAERGGRERVPRDARECRRPARRSRRARQRRAPRGRLRRAVRRVRPSRHGGDDARHG